MKKAIIFLFVVVSAILNAQEKQSHTNEDYAKLAFAIKERIFALKDKVNQDKNGYLHLVPHDLFSPDKEQTRRGIFLECEFGLPRALHLPIGRWQFISQTSVQKQHDQKLMQEVLASFKAELLEKRPRIKGVGSFGSPSVDIYAVTQIDDEPLEKPEYKLQTEYMDDRHAVALWKALKPQQPEGTP